MIDKWQIYAPLSLPPFPPFPPPLVPFHSLLSSPSPTTKITFFAVCLFVQRLLSPFAFFDSRGKKEEIWAGATVVKQ